MLIKNGNTISWLVPNSEKECNGTRDNKTVVKDYGLIIRMINPFSLRKEKPTSVTIFCGCHTYGTIAAAKYFTQTHISEYKGFKKIKPNIAILVECDVVDGYPVGISKIKQHEF